jgi:hypothetical protein
VDDSDNENEEKEMEAVTPGKPLQLLLSPMSSMTNLLESMQFSEHQRLRKNNIPLSILKLDFIESSLATKQLDIALLSPERTNYHSPTKKNGLEDSPDTTIKSCNLVSPDHEGGIPTFDLSPYKTPTKRSDSPDIGIFILISFTVFLS